MLRSGGGSTNFSKTVLSFLLTMVTDANAACLAESPDQTTNISQSMATQSLWTSESHGSGRRYGVRQRVWGQVEGMVSDRRYDVRQKV